jgi:ProP effector
LLKQLRQAFKIIGGHRPLAIGIDKQILESRPDLSRKLLRGALGIHTQSRRYLVTLQAATKRFNLDGTPAGEVSAEQQALASKKLKDRHNRVKDGHALQAAKIKAEQLAEDDRKRQEKLNQLMSKFSHD